MRLNSLTRKQRVHTFLAIYTPSVAIKQCMQARRLKPKPALHAAGRAPDRKRGVAALSARC